MNKYIRGVGGIISGTAKALVLRIERGSSAIIALPALISAKTEVTIDKGGTLFIGKHASMRSGSRIAVRKKGELSIGDNFYMNNGCIITAHDRITIGDNVELGPGVLIYDQDHDYQAEGGLSAKAFKTDPVSIGNNVWIGAYSIILRGTTIGDNCVIGAGSVIKGTFPNDSVIVQKRSNDTVIKEKQDK